MLQSTPVFTGTGTCTNNQNGGSTVSINSINVTAEAAQTVNVAAGETGQSANLARAIDLLVGARFRADQPTRNFDVYKLVNSKTGESIEVKKEWDVEIPASDVATAVQNAQRAILSPKPSDSAVIVDFTKLSQDTGKVISRFSCENVPKP